MDITVNCVFGCEISTIQVTWPNTEVTEPVAPKLTYNCNTDSDLALRFLECDTLLQYMPC